MNIFVNAIHTEKHKLPNGKILVGVIEYDHHATNPRTWSNLGTILIAPNKSHWIGRADELGIAEYEIIESCWDYVGDIGYCHDELQSVIKNTLTRSKRINSFV